MERPAPQREHQLRRQDRFAGLPRALALFAAAALISPGLAVAATASAPDAPDTPAYHAVALGSDGRATSASLDELAVSLRGPGGSGPGQMVLLIHGFATTRREAAAQYQEIAAGLKREGKALGLNLAVVGLTWDANPGAVGSWLPRAIGHRIVSLLGFRNAMRNSYLQKVQSARQAGYTGLRAVLFRLQDDFPGVPLHVIAHSLGAEATLSALAPRGEAGRSAATVIEQPGRTLRLDMVLLAGADVDDDVFSREPAADSALLQQAQVWWITVPRPGRADAALELRRGAGRAEAVGNAGLRLDRKEMDLLLTRRALVLDECSVPVLHRFRHYLNAYRVRAFASSVAYLQDPRAPAGRTSILADLDAVLKMEPAELSARVNAPAASAAASCACSVRAYTSWRLGSSPMSAAHIRVIEPRSLSVAALREVRRAGDPGPAAPSPDPAKPLCGAAGHLQR